MRTRLLPLFLVAVLAACAPSTEGPRVAVEQLTEPLSFYPRETGATWQYLPDSARLEEQRVYRRVEGPTVLDGRVVTAVRMIGRGLDEINYLTFGPEGALLWQTERPGSVIRFDPPVRELPPESQLTVGATWGGETVATVRYPDARPENRETALDIRYSYTVVDRRTARVPAGEFEVFVIDFNSVTVDEDGRTLEDLSQTTWFVPHVGEVRTENGYFLVEANFDLAEEAETAE